MLLASVPKLSIHSHTPLPQIRLSLIDLFHELLMRFRYIVEREDAVAKIEEEVCAERHDGPQR